MFQLSTVVLIVYGAMVDKQGYKCFFIVQKSLETKF